MSGLERAANLSNKLAQNVASRQVRGLNHGQANKGKQYAHTLNSTASSQYQGPKQETFSTTQDTRQNRNDLPNVGMLVGSKMWQAPSEKGLSKQLGRFSAKQRIPPQSMAGARGPVPDPGTPGQSYGSQNRIGAEPQLPMKRLLKAQSSNLPVGLGYATSGSDMVQIVTHNSGFDQYQTNEDEAFVKSRAQTFIQRPLTGVQADERQRLQVYNRMRQAELLRKDAGNLGRPRPFSNRVTGTAGRGNSALSSLLSYPSPRSLARRQLNKASQGGSDANVIPVMFLRDQSANIVTDSNLHGLQQITSVESENTEAGKDGIVTGNYTIAKSAQVLAEDPLRSAYQLNITPLQQHNQLAVIPQAKSAAVLAQKPEKQQEQRTIKQVTDGDAQQLAPKPNTGKGKLDFETKVDASGKLVIAVPRGRQSKFSERKTPREYSMCVLDDQELSLALSTHYISECRQLEKIQEAKKLLGHSTFVEDIQRLPINLTYHRDRQKRKRHRMDVANEIQERKESELEKRRQGKAQTEPATQAQPSPSKGGFPGKGSNFDYMNIDELKQHGNGILNLFEGDKVMAQYDSHNKIDAKAGKSKSYVRLSQQEYDTIFERDPSFNEKKAFVDVFRRKWREDKGYCSMFDKRSNYKLAKSKSIEALTRTQQLQSSIKARVHRQMLENRAKRLLNEQAEMKEKEAQEQEEYERYQRDQERVKAKKEKRLKEVMEVYDRQRAQKKILSLEKEESLEDLMLLLDRQHGGRLISPRARSASHTHAKRDKSFEPKTVKFEGLGQTKRAAQGLAALGSDGNSAGEEDDLELKGTQAKMHYPLQNHDQDQLSHFITQMYATRVQPPALVPESPKEQQRVLVQLSNNRVNEVIASNPTLNEVMATEHEKITSKKSSARIVSQKSSALPEVAQSRTVFDRIQPSAMNAGLADTARDSNPGEEPTAAYQAKKEEVEGKPQLQVVQSRVQSQKQGKNAIAEREGSPTSENPLSEKGGKRKQGEDKFVPNQGLGESQAAYQNQALSAGSDARQGLQEASNHGTIPLYSNRDPNIPKNEKTTSPKLSGREAQRNLPLGAANRSQDMGQLRVSATDSKLSDDQDAINHESNTSFMLPKNHSRDVASSNQKDQPPHGLESGEKTLIKKHKSLDPVHQIAPNEGNPAQPQSSETDRQSGRQRVPVVTTTNQIEALQTNEAQRKASQAALTDQSTNQTQFVRISQPNLLRNSSKEGVSSDTVTNQAEKILAEFAEIQQKEWAKYAHKAALPSVFKLPHNPISNQSYKQNYIKSRIEGSRLDYLQSNPTKVYKTLAKDQPPLDAGDMSDHHINPDLNVSHNDSLGRIPSNDAVRKRSSNEFYTTNTYIKHQKLVTLKKKEQQFCYYMQQHRQNKHKFEATKTAKSTGVMGVQPQNNSRRMSKRQQPGSKQSRTRAAIQLHIEQESVDTAIRVSNLKSGGTSNTAKSMVFYPQLDNSGKNSAYNQPVTAALVPAPSSTSSRDQHVMMQSRMGSKEQIQAYAVDLNGQRYDESSNSVATPIYPGTSFGLQTSALQSSQSPGMRRSQEARKDPFICQNKKMTDLPRRTNQQRASRQRKKEQAEKGIKVVGVRNLNSNSPNSLNTRQSGINTLQNTTMLRSNEVTSPSVTNSMSQPRAGGSKTHTTQQRFGSSTFDKRAKDNGNRNVNDYDQHVSNHMGRQPHASSEGHSEHLQRPNEGREFTQDSVYTANRVSAVFQDANHEQQSPDRHMPITTKVVLVHNMGETTPSMEDNLSRSEYTPQQRGSYPEMQKLAMEERSGTAILDQSPLLKPKNQMTSSFNNS